MGNGVDLALVRIRRRRLFAITPLDDDDGDDPGVGR